MPKSTYHIDDVASFDYKSGEGDTPPRCLVRYIDGNQADHCGRGAALIARRLATYLGYEQVHDDRCEGDIYYPPHGGGDTDQGS